MTTQIGIWIDHRKAIVVDITEQGEKIEEIVSGVEKQLQRAGDRPLEGNYESVQVPADNRRQRYFTKHLNIYYAAVITAIRDAESILIFGPGEAKGELMTKILNLWTDILNACRQAWWIEILTAQPNCTYYFGPFAGAWEAKVASKGFIEDLEGEFAQGITIKIDRHSQPDLLTIEHDSIKLLGA